MKLITLFALCVLHAHAATIQVPEKKLEILSKDHLDHVISEAGLFDPSNTVKDIDNNLRNSLGIPFIKESAKPLDENSNDYVPNNDDGIKLKRTSIDIGNSSTSQRQEHKKTQNTGHYSDTQNTIFAIRQSIEDTQKNFTNGLNCILQGFSNLLSKNEQISTIQENIQNLRRSFDDQVSKLNSTIKSYINLDKVDLSQKELTNVETRLKELENNFKTGVKSLFEGLELLAFIKKENEAAARAGGDTAAAAGSPLQFIYNFQQGIIGSFNNLNNAVQGFFNQGQQNQSNTVQSDQPVQPEQGGFISNLFQGLQLPFTGQQGQNQANPPGAAADVLAQQGSWKPPNIVQSLQNSWNNIVNPNQNQQQSQQQQQQNPISQAFQNVVNVFNKPNQASQSSAQANLPNPGTAKKHAANVQHGVNVSPCSNVESASLQSELAKPGDQPPAKQEPAKETGPIQQLVQNNPIIKGLQTVAQRMTNPEKPKDDVVNTKNHGVCNNGDIKVSRIQSQVEDKEQTSELKEKITDPEPAKTE